MSKTIKLKDDTYIDSSGIMHICEGMPYARATLKDYLPKVNMGSPLYTTHYMQLGYINCTLRQDAHWSNLTLCINGSFYGVQHWSTHILTIAQASNVKANAIKVGGDGRSFFYKVDSTNSRIYIYAGVWGGNGFGYWATSVLNRLCCSWVSEVVHNVEYEDTWVAIGDGYPNPTTVIYENSSGIVAGSSGNSVGVSVPVTNFNAILIEHDSGTCIVGTKLDAYNRGYDMSIWWFNSGYTGTFYNKTIYKIIGLK